MNAGVTVNNNLTESLNGTSIHWHGLRQYHANWQDGTPGVTQCPIKPGSSQTYEFKLTQYGTSWYHGHFSMQYSNGLYGPLIIHGPSSANWDVDLGPWLLSDWYHDDVFGLISHDEVTADTPAPDSTIINGKGKYNCSTNDTLCTGTGGEYFETLFDEGKTYRFTIANTATVFSYNFWIDGHNLTVISTDFVPIEPVTTDILTVEVGQRYEVVIHANASLENGTNFWIHAQDCLYPTALDWRAGIIRYDSGNTSDPYTPPTGPELDAFRHLDLSCALDFATTADVIPVVPQNVVREKASNITAENLLRLGRANGTWPFSDTNSPPLYLWVMENTPLAANWSQPTIKTLALDNGTISDLPDYAVPIELDYDTGDWVHVVVTSNYTAADVAAAGGTTRYDEVSRHPMHLHGHDFAILAQGFAPFDPVAVTPNLQNPPRRDTLNLPAGAFAWIAFQVDNPGAWVFHCHNAWHSTDGMALQYIEQPEKLRNLMEEAGVTGQVEDQCAEFTSFYNTVNIPANAVQEDSGV